jgi:hypothetical protein
MSNQNHLALSLDAVTVSTDGGDMENNSGHSAIIVIDITALTGGGTATFTLQGKDPHSAKYYNILASTALAGTGTTILRVGAGLTAAANLVVNDIMPKTFRVIYTEGATAVTTATVSVLTVG